MESVGWCFWEARGPVRLRSGQALRLRAFPSSQKLRRNKRAFAQDDRVFLCFFGAQRCEWWGFSVSAGRLSGVLWGGIISSFICFFWWFFVVFWRGCGMIYA